MFLYVYIHTHIHACMLSYVVFKDSHTLIHNTHTYIHTYIYIYMYTCYICYIAFRGRMARSCLTAQGLRPRRAGADCSFERGGGGVAAGDRA